MDTALLQAFDLDVGDGIYREGVEAGEETLLPMLYASSYDGQPKRYHHFGRAVLGRKNGLWCAGFGENEQGFVRFLEALKRFQLHDHRFWQKAYQAAAAVWRRPEMTAAAQEKVFFFIDAPRRQVLFFENPTVALLFDTLEKTAHFAQTGALGIELADG